MGLEKSFVLIWFKLSFFLSFKHDFPIPSRFLILLSQGVQAATLRKDSVTINPLHSVSVSVLKNDSAEVLHRLRNASKPGCWLATVEEFMV